MPGRAFVLALSLAALAGVAPLAGGAQGGPASFRFAIVGDRTGEAVPGVFQQTLREAAGAQPAFVVSVGDLIEGLHDETAASEWREFDAMVNPFRGIPFYAAPGNHDVWSQSSEALYESRFGRALHYSFDYGAVHFTVLDNSRSDDLPATELAFLESDLQAHASQPIKLVFMHRPSWLIDVAVQNPNFELHRLARKYHVQYVIAGHLHQLLRFELEGVTYVSMVSSGGHLRASQKYQDGWFFGYAVVDVNAEKAALKIRELKPPYGQGRETQLGDWGMLGELASPRK